MKYNACGPNQWMLAMYTAGVLLTSLVALGGAQSSHRDDTAHTTEQLQFPGDPPTLSYLRSRSVQTALHLSDEQRRAVNGLDAQWVKHCEQLCHARLERKLDAQDFVSKISDIRQELDLRLNDILGQEQTQRLDQIRRARSWPNLTLGLLRNPLAQEDLGLSQEQRHKIEELFQQWIEQQREHRFRAPKGEKYELLTEDFRRRGEKTLNGVQQNRLAQIRLQEGVAFRGAAEVLMRPSVVRVLGLDATQTRNISRLAQEVRKLDQKVTRSPTRDEFIDSLSRLAKLRAENGLSALSLLSNAQNQRWQELLGEPFVSYVEW